MLPPSLLELNSGEPEIQTLSNLWVSANAAFDSCDFGGALSDLDAAVAEVEQNVLAIVLLKRAVAHSCQGNTQAAIQDAYKVIKLAPRLPEGYLCAGSLLKSAKRYGEAIEIYWNGIQATESFGDTNDCASRKNNEGHQRIVRAKHIIEESINRINDQPLKKLPLELAHHIFFDLLSFEDRLQSMYTCRWWRAFLVEELPRISLRLVLGSMPKQAMVQLVAGYSSRHLNEELGFKNRHAVSILPNTSAVSFKNALMLLNDFSVRIKHLDVLSELDGSEAVKESLGRVLRQNKTTLKRLTLCTFKDVPTTVDALDNCPNLSHLIISGHHNLLAEDYIPSTTFSGRKIKFTDWENTCRYAILTRQGRTDNTRQTDTGLGMTDLAYAAVLAQERRQRLSLPKCPTARHRQLKRLDLLGMETTHFLHPSFWQHLSNLEHIAISTPIGLSEDCYSIIQHLGDSCPNLKTLRYGIGWEGYTGIDGAADGGDNKIEEERRGEIDEGKEKGRMCRGLRELAVRIRKGNPAVAGNEPDMTFTLLRPGFCDALQVLNLQLNFTTQVEVERLVQSPMPRLRELQLHVHYHSLIFGTIQPHLIAALVKNCPALERVVLNRTRLSADALFEFTNARQQLRSLCVAQEIPLTPILNVAPMPRNPNDLPGATAVVTNAPGPTNGIPATTALSSNLQYQITVQQLRMRLERQMATPGLTDLQRMLLMQQTQQRIAAVVNNGDPAGGGRGHLPKSIFRQFAAKYTRLTDICIASATLNDSDLAALTSNNHALATIKLIACQSLTASGLEAAFSSRCVAQMKNGVLSSLPFPQPLRHVTLVQMNMLEGFVITGLVKVPSLEELVLIECQWLDYSTVLKSIEEGQHQRRIFASCSDNSPVTNKIKAPSHTKQHVLKTYYICNLSEQFAYPQETRLIECMPWQQSLVTRTLPDIAIAKPIFDYI